MSPLPSMNSLQAFAAAARLLSIQDAVQELHLTASAVSHRVKAFEEFCGYPVFKRLNRRIELTSKGENLLPKVEQILQNVGTFKNKKTAQKTQLSLIVPPVFFSQLLLDKAASFPELQLHIAQAGFKLNRFDIAIRYGRLNRQGWRCERLFNTKHIAVAKPSLVNPGDNLNTLSMKYPCIDYAYAKNTWAAWQSELASNSQWITVSSMSEALTAARAGLGIAVTIKQLVTKELQQQQLQLVSNTHKSRSGFFLAYKTAIEKQPEFLRFQHWLQQYCSQFGD